MSELTAPLTPPDCDLRDFARMMLDVQRVLGSEFNAIASRNPIAWMVGHKLWYRAWHQVPTASLPADDEQLCHLAELGFDMKTWRKVKDIALRGWVLCADGRLYHPIVAEVALEAWIEKLLQRLSSGAGNAKRYHYAFDPAPINEQINEAAALLINLNPGSRTLDKLKRRESRNAPATPADDLPPGAPVEVPLGSQETGTETGILEEAARAREADDWPDPSLEACAQKLVALAGPGLADPAKEQGLLLTRSELHRWRRAGCSWLLDVVPAVQAKTAKARASPIRTWTLFSESVLANQARRLRPNPTAEVDHGQRSDRLDAKRDQLASGFERRLRAAMGPPGERAADG